jgi:hypothetical protein
MLIRKSDQLTYTLILPYFNKSHLLGFELETSISDTILSYYVPICYTKNPKLMKNDGHLYFNKTYVLLVLTGNSHLQAMFGAVSTCMLFHSKRIVSNVHTQ